MSQRPYVFELVLEPDCVEPLLDELQYKLLVRFQPHGRLLGMLHLLVGGASLDGVHRNLKHRVHPLSFRLLLPELGHPDPVHDRWILLPWRHIRPARMHFIKLLRRGGYGPDPVPRWLVLPQSEHHHGLHGGRQLLSVRRHGPGHVQRLSCGDVRVGGLYRVVQHRVHAVLVGDLVLQHDQRRGLLDVQRGL